MARKILMIDDEVDFTQMVKMNLEKGGQYQVRTENKGAQGYEAAKEFAPDLILLDLIMPDMEGSDVASQIVADSKFKNTPIIFLTATVTQKETQVRDGIIGGRLFVAKPVKLDDLKRHIEKYLGKSS